MATSRRTTLPLATIFLQIAALGALAVAQPLVQLVKENPEFLTVHHSRGPDVLLLATALFLGLPAILSAIVLCARWIAPRAGLLVQAAILGVLLALILLPLLDRLPGVDARLTVILGAAAGALFAVGYLRSGLIRANLAILALAVPVCLLLFLGSAPIRRVLLPAPTATVAPDQAVTHPVVVVILDELPTASLMRPDLGLDCELFPSFCRLAARSTWYRNATTISGATLRSVPAILTGKLPRWKETPSLADHPDNLFTLLASSHRVWALEVQTSLCPEDLASTPVPALGDRLELLLTDLWILYQHLVVPAAWRSHLTPVADKWGNFLADPLDDGGVVNGPTRLRHLADFVASVQVDDRLSLIVAHTLLPHSPFQFLPDGRFYNRGEKIPSEPDGTWRGDTEEIAHSYRRHLLQLAAVDRLLGELLDRLEELGILDDAAIVVTADHGISFRPGHRRRNYDEGNEADLLFVPLFLKLPGQQTGAVDDRFVQTIDIMPSLASALGIELPWDHAGRDLVTSEADRDTLLFLDQDARQKRRFGREIRRDRDAVVAWKDSLFAGPGGVERLFSGFDPGGLLGRRVADLDLRPHPEFRGRVLDAQKLDAVDLDGSYVPAQLDGIVEGHAGEERLTLALAVNGKVAGAARSYLERDEEGAVRWQITVPPSIFRDGANEVDLLLLDEAGPWRIPLYTPSFLGTNLGGTRVAGIDESGLFGTDDWDGRLARWTDGHGRWTIPLKPGERPTLLEVGIVSSGPPGAELEVIVDGQRLLSQTLPRGDWEARVPLDGVPAGNELVVELQSSVFVPAEVNPRSTDRRELGVAVRKLVVR